MQKTLGRQEKCKLPIGTNTYVLLYLTLWQQNGPQHPGLFALLYECPIADHSPAYCLPQVRAVVVWPLVGLLLSDSNETPADRLHQQFQLLYPPV